jgi:inorganic pyrophosphatase
MDIKTLTLHPNHPEQAWIVVEQPRHEPYRLEFNPQDGTFNRTDHLALTYKRGFRGVYGWIGGTGLPPAPHFDILLVTRQSPGPGEVLQGFICGMFKHHSGDHKFVAVDNEIRAELPYLDLTALEKPVFEELLCLYPLVGQDEGWYCAETAHSYLKNNQPSHD